MKRFPQTGSVSAPLSPAQRHALEAIRDRRVLYYGAGRCVTLGYQCRRVRSNVAVRLIHEDLAELAPDGRELQLTHAGRCALAESIEALRRTDDSYDGDARFDAAIGETRG